MISIDKKRTKRLTKFTEEELNYLQNYIGSLSNCCKDFEKIFEKTITKAYISQLRNKKKNLN